MCIYFNLFELFAILLCMWNTFICKRLVDEDEQTKYKTIDNKSEAHINCNAQGVTNRNAQGVIRQAG